MKRKNTSDPVLTSPTGIPHMVSRKLIVPPPPKQSKNERAQVYYDIIKQFALNESMKTFVFPTLGLFFV